MSRVLLIFSFLILSRIASAESVLECIDGGAEGAIIIGSTGAGGIYCTDQNLRGFEVNIISAGAEFHLGLGQYKIRCQNDNFAGTYLGAQVSCAIGAGCTLRLIGNNDNTCVMYGFETGLGGGISVNRVEIIDTKGYKNW